VGRHPALCAICVAQGRVSRPSAGVGGGAWPGSTAGWWWAGGAHPAAEALALAGNPRGRPGAGRARRPRSTSGERGEAVRARAWTAVANDDRSGPAGCSTRRWRWPPTPGTSSPSRPPFTTWPGWRGRQGRPAGSTPWPSSSKAPWPRRGRPRLGAGWTGTPPGWRPVGRVSSRSALCWCRRDRPRRRRGVAPVRRPPGGGCRRTPVGGPGRPLRRRPTPELAPPGRGRPGRGCRNVSCRSPAWRHRPVQQGHRRSAALSPRTVENKLHAAYGKLGVRGRDELADALPTPDRPQSPTDPGPRHRPVGIVRRGSNVVSRSMDVEQADGGASCRTGPGVRTPVWTLGVLCLSLVMIVVATRR